MENINLGKVKIICDSWHPSQTKIITEAGVNICELIPVQTISINSDCEGTKISMTLCPIPFEASAEGIVKISDDIEKAIKALGYVRKEE